MEPLSARTPQEHLEQCKSVRQQVRQIRKSLAAANQPEPESVRRIESDLSAWIEYAENKTHQPAIQKALQNFTYAGEGQDQEQAGKARG
jgi:hypothetical protein